MNSNEIQHRIESIRIAAIGMNVPLNAGQLAAIERLEADLAASRMSEIYRAATKAREWTSRRDALIREGHAKGQSLRVLAAQARLSHTAIAKIVAR